MTTFRDQPTNKRGFAMLGIAVMAFALVACTPRIDPRGNLPDAERLAEIKPGEQTRDEVAEILGSPSTIGNFDGETWIYIAEQTETLAFFEPEVKERQVVILKFDKEGIVTSIDKLSAGDGKKVQHNERETPTVGYEITIMEQLLGNLGRF